MNNGKISLLLNTYNLHDLLSISIIFSGISKVEYKFFSENDSTIDKWLWAVDLTVIEHFNFGLLLNMAYLAQKEDILNKVSYQEFVKNIDKKKPYVLDILELKINEKFIVNY